MKNIHRYYEPVNDNFGFLHDVCYDIDSENKALVTSLQTHTVIDSKVDEKIISHEDPLNEVTVIAAYSILAKDGVMDIDANMLIKH